MKTLLLLTIFGVSLSLQEGGYYHKQYQYKSSSSSYKNNELQHKTDDEEFSSVHGDLSGRDDPKVNAYSQHTEYRNPNAQEPIESGYGGNQLMSAGASGRYQNQNLNTFGTNSYGSNAYESNSYGSNSYGSNSYGALGSNPDDVTGSISGKRKHITYSGTYTVSGGQSKQLQGGNYDTQSELLDLTQKVQNSLSSQLSRAISEQRRSGHQYSTSYSNVGVENEIRNLEDELRANLTRSLQEELNTQYGSQTQRGSYSYSGSQIKPNYNTQELEDLTQQVRTNLLDQLKREYQTSSTSSSSSTKSSKSSYSNSYGNQPIYNQPSYSQLSYNQPDYNQPGYTQSSYTQPSYNQPNYQRIPSTSQISTSSSDYSSRAHTTMYTKPSTPTIRPSQQLVDVTSNAQSELDMSLNRALTSLKTKYMNDDTYKNVYNQPDYNIILNDLTRELKQNVTMEIQNALRNAYGLQEEKNGYYFSTWNVNANIANYKTEDLDNLKRQVEKNLLDKLTQEIRNQETSYSEKRSQYNEMKRTQSSNYPNYPSGNVNNNRQYSSHSSQSSYSSSSSYGINPYPSSNQYKPNTYNQNQPDQQIHQNNQDQQEIEEISYPNRYPSGSSNYNLQRNTYDQHQQVENVDYHQQQTQRPGYYHTTYPKSTNYPSQYSNQPGNYPNYPSPSSSSNTYTSSHNSESSYQQVSQQQPKLQSSSQLSSAEITRIDDELRRDLNQQIQRVVQLQNDQEKSYSSSSGHQQSQVEEVDFTEEFKQNFSRRIDEVLREHGINGGYSFTIYSSGGSLSSGSGKSKGRINVELLRMMMDDLLRQLREQLASRTYTSNAKITFQPSHSYPSGYRTQTGSSGGYQMQSGYREVEYQQGTEDCMQSDEASTTPKAIKPPRSRGDISVELEAAPFDVKPTEKPKARDVVTSRTTPRVATTAKSVDNNGNVDLTQKLQQLTNDVSKQLGDITQQNQDFRQINQQTQNLNQQTQNLNQQTQNLNQQTQDLTQQIEKLPQQTYFKPQSSDLTQQTEDFRYFDQQTYDLSQKTEDLTQQTEDFHHFDQQQSSSDLIQQSEDLTQQTEDLTQQTENLSQQSYVKPLRSDLIQQTEDFPNPKQKPFERTQIAQVEEVPRIEQKPEKVVEEKNEETTTQQSGFWKKLGGKITSGFNSVKDKVQSIG